jgi:hypothetical protein
VAAFDHNVATLHNQLVKAGAPSVLLRCLERALEDEKRRDEVDPICQLLCMLYRCSDRQAEDSLVAVGGELYPFLIAILFLGKTRQVWKVPESAYQLIHRLRTLEVNLRAMRHSGPLLRLFREVIENVDVSVDLEPLYHVMELLATLSRNSESKTLVIDYPGLFDSVVLKFSNSFRPGRKVNRGVIHFLHALALSSRNKGIMVEKHEFFRLLFLLLHDDDVDTRRETLVTLKLIAMENFGRSTLFVYWGHRFVDSLIRSVRIEEVAVASLEVLIQLICRDTAMMMCKHKDLLDRLTCLASAKSGITQSSPLAAHAIKRLSTYVPLNGKGMWALLEAIVQLSSSEHHRIRLWGARAFVEQSQMPACSFVIMRTPHVVDLITELLMDENPTVKSNAIAAVFNLACSPMNLRVMGRNRLLMDALADAITDCKQVDDAARRQAVLTILCLANHQKSMKMVAKQHNVVASLSRYGVSADEDKDLKKAALHGVIWLVPHM